MGLFFRKICDLPIRFINAFGILPADRDVLSGGIDMGDSKISTNAIILGAIGLAVAGGVGHKLYTNYREHTDPEVEVQMSGSLRSGFTCTIVYDKGFDFRLYEVSYDAELDSYREELRDYGDFGDGSAITLVDRFPSDGLVDSVTLDWIFVKDPLMREYWEVTTTYSVDGSPELTDEDRELATETMAKWRKIFKVDERCLAEDRD